MNAVIGTVRRADIRPDDYVRFGVNPDAVEDREDGMREDPKVAGSFEWWYFEIGVPDQATIVVAFLTKPLEHQDGVLQPVVSIKVKFADEDKPRGDDFKPAPDSFKASLTGCDVQAGGSSCKHMGKGLYHLELHEVDIAGTIDLQAIVPRSRIGTGHVLFELGSQSQHFGWVVPVPFGLAKVNLTVGGKTVSGGGGGYHDHNWGDRPMAGPVHHWYWGRAFVDDYIVIAANTVPQQSYGGADHVDLVLMKDGRFITQGNKNASFTQSPTSPDPVTGKPVADVTTYTFTADDGTGYVLSFTRQKTVVARTMGSIAYHRFAGEFKLQVTPAGGTSTVHRTDRTTWELMWLGDKPLLSDFALYTRMLSDPDGVAPSLHLPP